MDGHSFRKFDIQEKTVFCIRWFYARDRNQSPTNLNPGGMSWFTAGHDGSYCTQASNHRHNSLSPSVEYLSHSLWSVSLVGNSLGHSEFTLLQRQQGSFSPYFSLKKSKDKILVGLSCVTSLPPVTVARQQVTVINPSWKRHLHGPKWVGKTKNCFWKKEAMGSGQAK